MNEKMTTIQVIIGIGIVNFNKANRTAEKIMNCEADERSEKIITAKELNQITEFTENCFTRLTDNE